jgi:hypothetical protein
MPLVLGLVADTVVYVYPTVAAAETDTGVGGTGFLAYVPSESSGHRLEYLTPRLLDKVEDNLFVVTNRHVITNATNDELYPEPAIVARRNDGTNTILSIPGTSWRIRTEGDDIAVAPIDLAHSNVQAAAFPSLAFVTREDLSQFQIGIGVGVYYTGRFQSGPGSPSITALRFGNISAMPVTIQHPRFGLGVESFLIEGRARSGYSGSPVVPGLQGHRYSDGTATVTLSYSDVLLGIHWGNFANGRRQACGTGQASMFTCLRASWLSRRHGAFLIFSANHSVIVTRTAERTPLQLTSRRTPTARRGLPRSTASSALELAAASRAA